MSEQHHYSKLLSYADRFQRLQQFRQQVIDKLQAKKVASSMFQRGALTIGELESVLSSKTSFEAATTLVELVLKKSGEEVYFRFLEAVQTEQYFIWESLSFADQNIDEKHVKLIQTHYSYLRENLDLRNVDVVGQLYSRKVLDNTDMEQLNCEPIYSDRVWKLLMLLCKKSAQQFDEFLNVLETTQQEYIVLQLRGTYTGSLSVTHVIPADGDRGVVGVTSVNNQLFVLREPSGQEIEAYDTKTYVLDRRLKIDGLSDREWWNSLTSCIRNNCLYVGDSASKTVYKLELTRGDNLSKWKVVGSPSGLSVNTACHVLVSCFDDKKLFEYTADGQLIREIKMNNGCYPMHSVELTSGQLVVCHWWPDPGDIIVVDEEGRVVSYKNNKQSTVQLMTDPRHLAIDKNDCILVAHMYNNRVVMLNSSLSCARDLPVTLDGGLNGPRCLYFDESRGRLLIGEYYGKKRVIVIDNIWSFQPT